jgi:hypothetical protein
VDKVDIEEKYKEIRIKEEKRYYRLSHYFS